MFRYGALAAIVGLGLTGAASANVVEYRYDGPRLTNFESYQLTDCKEFFFGCSNEGYTGFFKIDEDVLGRSLASTEISFGTQAGGFAEAAAVIDYEINFDVLFDLGGGEDVTFFMSTNENKEVTDWYIDCYCGVINIISSSGDRLGISDGTLYSDGLGKWTIASNSAPAPIPVPAALPLLGGALAGLSLLRRRKPAA